MPLDKCAFPCEIIVPPYLTAIPGSTIVQNLTIGVISWTISYLSIFRYPESVLPNLVYNTTVIEAQ